MAIIYLISEILFKSPLFSERKSLSWTLTVAHLQQLARYLTYLLEYARRITMIVVKFVRGFRSFLMHKCKIMTKQKSVNIFTTHKTFCTYNARIACQYALNKWNMHNFTCRKKGN